MVYMPSLNKLTANSQRKSRPEERLFRESLSALGSA
jgi:hypothetical protein